MAKTTATKKSSTPKTHTTTSKTDSTYANSYEAKMRALPITKRVATKVQRSGDRLARQVAAVSKWGPEGAAAHGFLAAAMSQLGNAIRALEAMPADFKPAGRAAGGGGGKASVEPGSIVAIRPKFTGKYGDAIPEAARDRLAVVDIRGSLVRVRTPDGETAFIPRGHLQVSTVLSNGEEAAHA